MTRPLRLLAVLPLIAALAACGGGGEEPEESPAPSLAPGAEPYVDAIAESLAAPEGSPVDQDQAHCFSEGLVSELGVERLEAAGTPEEVAKGGEDLEFSGLDITEAEGNDIYGWFERCGVDLREKMLQSFVDEESVPAETQECVEETLTDETVQHFFVTVLVSGDEAIETDPELREFTGDLMGCMMGGLGEEPSTE